MFVWNADALNDEQADAIRQDGNVFLIACPGSGKTRTLTYKVAYELSRITSNKKFVIAITYTHRAADEIHERVENLGVDTSQLWIGTIHSFCLEWIIKPYFIYHQSLKNGYRVIDPHDKDKLLESLCVPYKHQKITVWDCEYYFSKEGYVLTCQEPGKHASLQKIFAEYFKALDDAKQIDFELILWYSYELIETVPAISDLLSNLFSYILIDEYQDTKDIQYDIVCSILKAGQGETNAFVVGDPNQSIYESLGGYAIEPAQFGQMANIELVLLELSQNYRSTVRLVDYFGNYNFFETTIVAASDEKHYPSLITFDSTVTKDSLSDEIVRLIKYNVEVKGIAPNEICVLCPQWAPLASMTRQLVAKLPEYSFDGPGMAPFGRDVDNFWYKLSKIALTEPSPLIYVRRLRWAADVLRDLDDAGVDITKISKKSLLRECNSIVLAEPDGLRYLRAFFEALCERLDISIASHLTLKDHHEAFFASAEERVAMLVKQGSDSLGTVINFRKVFQARRGVTLSTIHGVKGGEFDAVIAFALLDGMVPHFRAPKQEESAKKLLYVICSRARKNLHLISESSRKQGYSYYTPTKILKQCQFTYDDTQ